ncbi:NADH-quinone oxidoreductase subunit N [Sphaerisporangium album]|uniref:NADH-quinone oxidoreductase subunit N n=1 Tax=Sphaerisporangium album TaxID=509200 RepID=A0A367FMF0_9ACTN|nr:NADH-quinone oxidoreductase subunit N [Sphaerisporangium album]RCG31558.1 NADH-quinone oxidoreductase subunit N [Sphaerisporangium album]
MTQSIDYVAIAPPLILALVAGLVLLLDAFLPRRPGTRAALGYVTLAGVVAALAVVAAQAVRGTRLATFCVGPGPAAPLRPTADPGACSFVVDHLTLIFAAVTLATAVVIVLLSMTQLARPPATAAGPPAATAPIPAGEWYFLLLCALTGAVTLPASRDLIMLVVSLELVSLPVFALTALKRYDPRASEAALKLFLVSVVSTAVMLFGVSLLYGLTGSVHLERIAASLNAPLSAIGAMGAVTPGTASADVLSATTASATAVPASVIPAGVLTVAVVLVLAGFAFKVAAVPFHFWAADVYQGAPVPVAALLSVISKAAGFAGLILVLTIALAGQADLWAPIIAALAALTMTVGNLLALRQRHAVRLLAWSSVAQSGYILAALSVAGKTAAAASIAYLVIYAAMNAGAFAVVMSAGRAGERNELEDYRGLAFRQPFSALALAFFLICLAGLPPGLAGLFAKVVVFREIVQGGDGWLAVVMAVNTVIGLYYYIAWTARLFTPAITPGAQQSGRDSARPALIAVAVALVISLAFSVAPQIVLSAVG